MITNIDSIKSGVLKDHICSLYEKILIMCTYCEDVFKEGLNTSKIQLRNDINRLLYHNVLGVDNPICLSDYSVYLQHTYVMVSISIDYKVFSQFKPYQDETIFVVLCIDNNEVRNYKIEKII